MERSILLRQSLRHADGVGVVEAQLVQERHAIFLLGDLVDEVVDRGPLRHVSGVQPEESGQQSAVIGDHEVAGMTVAHHGLEVVHLRHLVVDGDGEVGLVLHQHLHHMVHQLRFGVVAVVKSDVAGAAAAIGQQQAEGQDQRRHRDPHLAGAAPALAHLVLEPAHQQVQRHGDDHEHAGSRRDRAHVLDADGLGDHAAKAAAANEGCEYSRADGIDHSDADAGEHRGEGQGELHHQRPVGLAHAHAPGGLLHAGIDALQAQTGVADDGEEGVEGDAQDHGGLTGVQHHHDDAQQSQGGDGLQQVHDPQDHGAGVLGDIGPDAKGQADGDGEQAGGQHDEQML